MAERDAWAATGVDTELVARRDAEGTRTMGGALVAALVASAEERGVEIVAGCRVEDLACVDGTNYHDLNKAFRTIDRATGTHVHIPAWMVVDSAYVARYAIGGTPAGTPPAWAERGETVAELAQRCGIDPDGLVAALAEFNQHAALGRDPHFHRGESAQDRHLGDAARPHPCLAPLEQGPYHAIPIRPGTLGTCGGLVTDDDGRVLDRRGRAVPACTRRETSPAAVFDDAYPGGGATLGSAITRAYAAGRALADPDARHPTLEGRTAMSLFAVIYRYADDAAALDEHRPRHRDHLRALHEAGRLVVSGPLAEGGGPGALLVFRADSAEQVAGWLDDDPFKVLGLIVEREIRAWNPAFGADRLAPLSVS